MSVRPTADRPEFIGAHVRPRTKVFLREQSAMRGIPVSALVSEWIEEKLTDLGYDFSNLDDIDTSPTLPFEDQL